LNRLPTGLKHHLGRSWINQ